MARHGKETGEGGTKTVKMFCAEIRREWARRRKGKENYVIGGFHGETRKGGWSRKDKEST